MRFPRRHAKASSSRLSESSSRAALTATKTDIWISRLASISQFGLLLLTIGGFYFTVLPLYQKALLEEAIAKKEVELKGISAALEESYSRVRESVVKEFVFTSGASCSGLMLPPQNADLLGIHIPNRKPHAQEILEIEPKKCLVEALSKYPGLRNLRSEDTRALQDAVSRIASELDKRRSELIAKARPSWESLDARTYAYGYGEFVRSRILTLKSLKWNK